MIYLRCITFFFFFISMMQQMEEREYDTNLMKIPIDVGLDISDQIAIILWRAMKSTNFN